MSVLRPYKGYQGSVEYDDGILYIRLLHIEDSISTTCATAQEVTPAFHELVDDYIATCKSLGEEPNRPFKGSFNVRISPELHRSAAFSASARSETLNAWVAGAIAQQVQRDRQE
jgi:predicted HicB family RNase H-like nuclease